MTGMRVVRECLLVVGIAALLVGISCWEGRSVDLPLLAGFSLGVTAPLCLRRKLPLTAAVVSALVGFAGLWFLPGWQGLLVTMGVFSAAAYHRRRRPGLVVVVSSCWTLLFALLAGGPEPMFTISYLLVMMVAPGATGYALRLHRERVDQVVRLHRAEAAKVLAEERANLARDVHDSVGHHLTAIRMQATAARRVLDGHPPVADRALGTIAELSLSALREVRELLAALRGNPPGVGLAELDQLAEQLSGTDVRVEVVRSGGTAPLPPAVDHAAYRLAQEALTNAVRHSGATEIRARLHRDHHQLTVTVMDNGPGTPESGSEGQGIRGMRERVRSLGGTLSIGPATPHGWRVAAELPTGSTR